jgi:hypothetical protein
MKASAMRAFCLGLMLIPVSVALAEDQVKVTPGLTIQISAPGVSPTDSISVTLVMQPAAIHSANHPSDCSSTVSAITITGPSNNGFSLGIPPTICPGQYLVSVSQQKASQNNVIPPENHLNPSPQYIEVTENPPAVTEVSPKSFFKDGREQFSLVFFGPSSLKAGADYTLHIKGHVLANCVLTSVDTGAKTESSSNCFKYENETSQDGQIEFSLKDGGLLKELSGKQSVSLVHDGTESQGHDVFFIDANTTYPRNGALGVTAGLVILIYLLLNAGRKGLAAGTNGRTFLLTALFLDEETQTYSLSKCQFYAWTLAAVLGYVFLAVARSVIQGSAVFPDIPSGLPGILMVSVGTSVLSAGITTSKGSKGAGEVHPTLADFVTSGGLVAPERLQFVVWTVVGIFTFLTIVFKSDPLAIQDLPRIPDGFLQLMGISSAGYLAGKLARKPGPVIKSLSVANVTPSQNSQNLPNQFATPSGVVLHLPVLTLDIKGENLAPNALVKVDGQPLRGDMYWITSAAPDPQSGFCNELNVSLNDAADYLAGTHTLTVVNGDAQAADVVFPIDPMTIVGITVPAAAANGQDVTVTGTNFAVGSSTTAVWQDDNGNAIPWQDNAGNAIVPAVTVQSATQLILNRPPTVTPTSHSTLVLTTPLGLKASKKL